MRRTLLAFVLGLSLFTAHPALAATVVPYGSVISTDTTWDTVGSPYVVSMLTVASGTTLTVNPGVVVKMQQSASYHLLYVDGTLSVGSPSDPTPVVFTAYSDDSVGGDTNGDGADTLPASGSWNEILLNPGSRATFMHTIVRYGGATPYNSWTGGFFPYGLIENNGGTLTVDRSELSDSRYYGIVTNGGITTLIDSQVRRTVQSGISARGNLEVKGSTFTDLPTAITLSKGLFDFGGNTFQGTTPTAVFVQGNGITFLDRGGNTGRGGIALYLTVEQDLTLAPDGLPYILDYLFVNSGTTLTLLPGVVLKQRTGAYGLFVDGTLISGALDPAPTVVITSLLDDSVGGDTNLDGTETTPYAGAWQSIELRSGSHTTFMNTDMRYGGGHYYQYGLPYYEPMIKNLGGDLNIDHLFFADSARYGIMQSAGTMTITNSTFVRIGQIGLWVRGGTASVHDSAFSDIGLYGVANETPVPMDATSNWWGSLTGPFHGVTNPLGVGAPVSDQVLYRPYLLAEPHEGYSNVLFLPGIMGSRLYDSTGEIRWLPEDDEEADYVRMNSDGTSVFPDITTLDAIDTADFQQVYTDVYKSFLLEMESWKSEYNITATSTPYDWRLDYDTVVTKGRKLSDGHISYLLSPEAGHDPYIIETLKQLASSSPTGRVTIIGHSQGGLIAKALMQHLGTTTTAQLIDKVIMVATPQLGTPKAVAALLNGTNAGITFAISEKRSRQLAQNMQSAYNLLPSAPYFTYVDDSVITISSSSLPTWALHYDDEIHWDGGMRNFMFDADAIRATPSYSDLNTPEIVDPLKLLRAKAVHESLDNWTPPQGVELITIAGWGIETLSGITYYHECAIRDLSNACTEYRNQITLNPQMVIDGDGTVVEPSALWANGAANTRYWVNLEAYNKDAIDRDHKNILEIPTLRTLVKNILIGTSTPIDYISTSAPAYNGSSTRLHFTLHSPLTLGFVDVFGNYTGATATSTILNVPGVSYERYGEVQWLSVPKELVGQLVMTGTGSGSFTLDAEETNGNDILSKTSFEGIPSSTSTIVTMNIAPTQSVTASSTLVVDYDGDGATDFSLISKVGEVVTLPPLDSTPPATIATTTGTLGTNNWYTSNVTVTLSTTDTDSGVASTTYSLDNGVSWSTYTIPFTIITEGSTTILYASTDTAGNREATTTLTLQIDKTAPEAMISVSTSTQDLLLEGKDTLGTTTVMKDTAGNYTLTDQAGHTTTLFFTKTYSGKRLTYAKLTGIQYDGGIKKSLPSSSFVYLWDTKTPTTLLSQTIAVDGTYLIQALFNKSKDKTTIVVLKKNVPINTQTFTGLRIPKLTTNKGVVGYSL